MTEKTLSDRIAACKELQTKIEKVDQENRATVDKIEQLKINLDQLQRQRDDLEKIQNDAPRLLIAGKLSDSDFSKNKRSLSELYSQIDDINALLEVYEKALERDYPSRRAELQGRLSSLMAIVRKKIADNLAADIADKANQQIRELVAVLSANGDKKIGYNVYIDLGQSIAASVFGEKNGTPLPPLADENKLLVKSVMSEFGV